jgi:hypothetical protein
MNDFQVKRNENVDGAVQVSRSTLAPFRPRYYFNGERVAAVTIVEIERFINRCFGAVGGHMDVRLWMAQ